MKSTEDVHSLRLAVGNIHVESFEDANQHHVVSIHENLFLAAEWLGIVTKRMGSPLSARIKEEPVVFNVDGIIDNKNLIGILEEYEHLAGTIKSAGVQPVLEDDRLNIAINNAYIYIKNAKFHAVYMYDRSMLQEEKSEIESKKRKSKEDKSRLERIAAWIGIKW